MEDPNEQQNPAPEVIQDTANEPEETAEETTADDSVDVAEATSEETQSQDDQDGRTEDKLTAEEIERLKNEKDENGVPKYNRLREAQRKLERAEKEALKYKEQLGNITRKQDQGKVDYTKEELAQFYNYTDNPEHKAWAEKEYRTLEKKELVSEVLGEVSKQQHAQQYQMARANAVEICKQAYPEAFAGNGQWNENSVLFQHARNIFFSDPTITNHPYGLLGAFKMASADLAGRAINQQASEKQKLNNQLRSLQKKTLIEGAGGATPRYSPSKMNSSLERLRQTGSAEDAREAMGEIFRKQGLIKD